MLRLPHKEFRIMVKKIQRKKRRKKYAQERDLEDERVENDRLQNSSYLVYLKYQERLEMELNSEEEKERKILHKRWIEREEEAQEKFRQLQETLEKRRKEKENVEKRIRLEWETKRREMKEELVEDARRRAEDLKAKEDEVKKQLSKQNDQLQWNPLLQWSNPINPTINTVISSNNPSDTDNNQRPSCMYYMKTGACKFGHKCSRQHPSCVMSQTLLFTNMFPYNHDSWLTMKSPSDTEYTDEYVEFYNDTLDEFEQLGCVVQFKISCNQVTHLRGNVYVQYEREEDAAKAFQIFNGRYYAGQSLDCQFVHITNWKSAICGMFNIGNCSRGESCNFLHVLLNLHGHLSLADRLDMSLKENIKMVKDRYFYRVRRHDRGSKWGKRKSDGDRSRSRSYEHKSRSRSYEREKRRKHKKSRVKTKSGSDSKSILNEGVKEIKQNVLVRGGGDSSEDDIMSRM